MRLGPLEIVLIIVVIIAVAVIARIVRGGRSTPASGKNATPPHDTATRIWNYLNRTGIALVIVGFLALVAAASFFRAILQSYLWSTVVIAAGLILVFLSRKRR